MAVGRWLDDAYGGEPHSQMFPTPRVHGWLKWSWPGVLVVMWAVSPWLHGAALPVGLAVWLFTVPPFYFADRRAAVNARKAGPTRRPTPH